MTVKKNNNKKVDEKDFVKAEQTYGFDFDSLWRSGIF